MIRWKDFSCDLQSDYNHGESRIIETDYKLFNHNAESNAIRVSIKDGGFDYQLDPVNDSVVGYVLCANGATYQAATVNKSGNQAWFIVPPDAYLVPGPCICSLFIVTGNAKSAVVAARMSIERVVTLPVLSPTSVVADITNVVGLLQSLNTAKDEAVAALGVWKGIIAPTYATNTAYSAGQYVIYNNNLYKVNTDIAQSANTGWSAVSKTQVTVGSELTDIINNIPIATVAETEEYLGI